MKIIIEENDELRIYIFTKEDLSLEDLGIDPKDDNRDEKLRPILYCHRYRPFVREEVWNIDKESIINDIITKFKSLKENEEVN